jgi:hypothetical protein
VWGFDLLHHNARDLRELPLIERKARLEKVIIAANAGWLHYSESFDDGLDLLKAADRMRLEGIVSKRRDAPYRPGAVGSNARSGARQTKKGGDCSSATANHLGGTSLIWFSTVCASVLTRTYNAAHFTRLII